MIQVSERAAQEIRRLLERENRPNAMLRMAVKGGGCAGMSYNLSFEDSPREYDRAFEAQGLKLLVDKKSYLFLNGTTLDYTTTLMGSGFEFKNPNAKKSCGCGHSFTV